MGLRPAEQQAGALGTVKSLVSRHGDKGCAQLPHVDGQTPGRLGGVQHKGNSTFPAQGRDALHRQDEAEHVGHMVTNDGPHRLVQLALKGADLSLRIKERACSHPDIDTKGVERSGDGVVLIAGDHHGVPGLQQGMNGEIQPMGGVGGEHHLFWALHLKELRRCLTGFKYIAKIIRENEGKAKYIGGGEESFGYLAGDYVRDKDAVSACSLAAEAAAWAMDTMGLTLYEWLQELYVKYGFFREGLVSVVRKGTEGAELIQKMMVEFRENPPKTIVGSPVVKINDFLSLETTDVKSGSKSPIEQDKSNVLQWFTEDGSIVSVRPSGTEPKIKFYFGVKAPLESVADFERVQAELDAKIEAIKKDLKLE